MKLFLDQSPHPDDELVKSALGDNYAYLEEIRNFLLEHIGQTREEWKYYGKKYGWTLKTFLKKRNLFFINIYDGYFSITFVFGSKAENVVLESDLPESLKETFISNRKYAEGRGLNIDVSDESPIEDIFKLIRIKVEN